MGQKTVLKCSQQSTDPRGLQQAVSFAWPLLCQARMGTGVNRAETQKIDLAVGVTAFSADNITTRRVCWGGSWALIPHGRANVTWMQLAKKKSLEKAQSLGKLLGWIFLSPKSCNYFFTHGISVFSPSRQWSDHLRSGIPPECITVTWQKQERW